MVHGFAMHSDHIPILSLIVEVAQWVRKQIFRFKAMWLESSDCNKVVKEAWQNHRKYIDMRVVMEKISHCSKELDVWSKEKFGLVRRRTQEARKNLIKL